MRILLKNPGFLLVAHQPGFLGGINGSVCIDVDKAVRKMLTICMKSLISWLDCKFQVFSKK